MRVLVVTVAILVLAIAGIWWKDGAYGQVRYRLTADVELDGVHYSGSTVWELTGWQEPPWVPLDWNAPQFSSRGEAIEIPLGNGETLFVLRRANNYVPYRGFGNQYFAACVDGDDSRARVRNMANSSRRCVFDLFPQLVLADEQGKLTVLNYSPRGRGVRATVLRTFAQRTGDEMNVGLVARHPWIAELPRSPPGGLSGVMYLEDFSRL